MSTPKRKKPHSAPHAWTLPQIEADAVSEGNEILFGPQRVKIVRTVVEFAPYPEAGPGRWQAVHRDGIVDAAIDAARSGITADMLTVLRESDFARGSLKKRLVEWRSLMKSIHET
jgi:uncharacterized protein YbjT (DUF2867 family)